MQQDDKWRSSAGWMDGGMVGERERERESRSVTVVVVMMIAESRSQWLLHCPTLPLDWPSVDLSS